MYLTQPCFCFRDRSRMPVCPLAPGTPFALQAQKRDFDVPGSSSSYGYRIEILQTPSTFMSAGSSADELGGPALQIDGWGSGCHNSRCCEELETTHELQSRALQIGPTPMTSSEMMTASSTGVSLILVGRSAKQLHSSVIAGSCTLSDTHQGP